MSIVPVILSGGSGTRLWPLSRKLCPKPFIRMSNGCTLFEETVRRATRFDDRAPLVVSNEEYRFYILEALEQLQIEANIVLEPAARNTAPALALAALAILEKGDELMLAMPSDHLFENESVFRETVFRAVPAATSGHIVTFGIVPTRPEVGYGYIHQGKDLHDNGFSVKKFIEKPAAESAEAMLKSGGYFWNSGIFLMSASVYLEELANYAPAVLSSCEKAWANLSRDEQFLRPDRDAFMAVPEKSIDYAIMEKTVHAVMLPLSCGWNDMGSWESLFHSGQQDKEGNVSVGDVLLEDVENSYIHAQNRLVAAVGLKDIAIVESEDAVLVLPLNRTQEVNKIVDILKSDEREEFMLHPVVYRPWGSYEKLAMGERFQVKRIVVKPGRSLSLQMHHHRSEHWIIVRGTAEITLGEEKSLHTENESVYIPIGKLHRLYNPGKIPLELVEVQSGTYLGEDDILRVEDSYGRK